jgi:hypothetical protein
MSPSGYRKLTGKKRTLTGFSQAWLGSDHLLIVNSSYYAERYQRFMLSDIQAIVISDAPKRTNYWQLIALLLAIASAGLALRAGSLFGKGFFAITGVIASAVAVRDISRGPRCRCVLQTAVNRERLLPVSRIRKAQTFLGAMTLAIEAVQGGIPAEELAQSQTFTAASLDSPAGSPVQPPEIQRVRSYMAEVFFGVLVLDSALIAVALRSAVNVAAGLLPTVYLAEFFLGVFALVQARSERAASSALVAVAFLFAIADPFALSGAPAWHALMAGFRQGMAHPPLRLDMLIHAPLNTILLSAGWRVTAGAIGLGTCFFERRQERP